jgi:hypothetical protein
MPAVSQRLILAGLVLIIVAPVLYYGAPYFVNSPDMFYVKAKVLQVQQGNIYADPITGYDTFHPPLYHVVLAGLSFLGWSIDVNLILLTIINVSLFVYFTYRLCSHLYDTNTAFIVCLLIPFIVEFMGSRNILLATSFNFSVPFFLGGLLVYLRSGTSYLRIGLAGLVWGIAFLISPVYLFLLALIFIRDVVITRQWRRFLILIGTFAVSIIPFFIHARVIISQNLHHSSTFALWRGLPDIAFFKNMLFEFVSPSVHDIASFSTLIAVVFMIVAGVIIIRRKKVIWFIPLSCVAYLLTYYHFSAQYAIRIELFISIFLIGVFVDGIQAQWLNRKMWLVPLIIIVGGSLFAQYKNVLDDYRRIESGWEDNQAITQNLVANLDIHLTDNEYVLCTKETYFRYIMPYKSVHALGAYRTMTYYQLDTIVASRLENDYGHVIQSLDYEEILKIANKYEMNAAVFSGRERKLPVYKTLASRWDPVYWDEYFIIMKRQD